MVIGKWPPFIETFTCLHRPDDFPLIRKTLRLYRPKWTVELGTHMCGFSAFLGDTVAEWRGKVLTVDNIRYPEVDALLDYCRNVYFRKADILKSADNMVLSWLNLGRSFLYCDDGDKNREVEIYAKRVPVGSLLGVHDYGTETDPEHMREILQPLGFQMVFREEFENLSNKWYDSLTRIWVRSNKQKCQMSLKVERC